jgi:tetratricopeptide (TPR) repeat protein
MTAAPEIKLSYREEFRSAHGEAFQHWFEKIAVALHGDDCFLAIRVTIGDGGLDGLVLKEGRVYQLYAPPSLASDHGTAKKVRADFNKARHTLEESLKIWTFIHNSPDGKVGHRTGRALATLKEENTAICIEAIGIDGLWERLEKLPNEKLASLFGVSRPRNQAESQIRALLNQAVDLGSKDNHRKALEVMEQALAIAEAEKLVNLQAEVLISLALISSARHGVGDRSHYFHRVQSMQNSITEAPVLVMFHRARGAYFDEKRDLKEAESAYLAAIAVASLPENAESCAELLCVARAEYVHLLCNANRTSEAEGHLRLAEAYARSNPAMLNGEIFQTALNAGLHWAAKTGNEDTAIERAHDLEASATTGYLALRISAQLIDAANNFSHIKCHQAALAASEAALRLTDNIPRETRDKFLPGAIYTLALVNFQAGRLEDALQKANSLVDLAATPDSAPIRFATQLASVISRKIGDLATAVSKGELALGIAPEVDASLVAKMNLADALADTGQTERALRLVREAYSLIDGRANIPINTRIDVLGNIANYSSQLGDNNVLQSAIDQLSKISIEDEKLIEQRKRISRRIEANTEIRKRIIDISLVGKESKIIKAALDRVQAFHRFIKAPRARKKSKKPEVISTLQQANALTIAPLMQWWEDTGGDYNRAALDYDYWGRGCFAQILQNLQAFPHSLNVAFEVRTLEDIRQALRLWSLYADFILLLWKGPTVSGQFLALVDGEWFGPWGAGYIITPGTVLKTERGRRRVPALGYGSWLPEEVTKFLVTEAKSFLASGRMLLVPASGVGCVSPGHGAIEQLLTESANCIPAIHRVQEQGLQLGLLPYALDVPLDVLFDFVNNSQDDLLHMRNLVFNKAADIKTNGLQTSSKGLQIEIADALKRLREQNAALVSKRNLCAGEQETQVGIAPFHISGRGLADAGNSSNSMFAPLLTLESMGYGWKIGLSSQSPPSYRYEPAEGEAIGAWLAPPKCGVQLLTVKAKK